MRHATEFLLKKVWSYRGCVFPPLAVAAAFAVLALMAGIVGDIVLPKPQLREIAGYPNAIDVSLMRLITESAIWWMLFAFLFWVVALFCIGLSAHLLLRSLKPQTETQWHAAFAVLFITGVVAIASLATADRSLVSMANLLRPMHLVSPRLLTLAEWTNAVGFVALAAMIASGSLMLMPGRDNEEITRKLRCSTQLLYAGAVLMLLWIIQTTGMYRFSATLVEAEERRAIWGLAPTVAMVMGVVVSLSLAIMYLSSVAWLNSRFAKLTSAKPATVRAKLRAAGPFTFIKSYWGQTAAVLTPMVPGVLQLMSNALKQAV